MDVLFYFEDEKLLEKYNNIKNKVSNSIKMVLDCKPIYNKRFFENQKKVSRS